jgi:predicted lipid-binding transport protein (Tim44 family)
MSHWGGPRHRMKTRGNAAATANPGRRPRPSSLTATGPTELHVMGGDFNLIQILIFAAVAAFLIYRLRSVLGRRTGHERHRRNPFTPAGEQGQGEQRAPDNVVHLPERGRGEEGELSTEAPPSLAAGLTQVRIADPGFDAGSFTHGSKRAFAMIVEAFAKGDTGTLRPLLSDDLFDEFSGEIRRRAAEGEVHETHLVNMKSADILEARMEGRTALVTVKFVTDQINVIRDDQDNVLEGDPEAVHELTDIWTFARNTRASDPNWTLVETRTPN